MELSYFLVAMFMKIKHEQYKHAPEQNKSSISIYFYYELHRTFIICYH